MTYKLLIVDDEKANLRLLERLFHKDYYCLSAASGADAIQILEQHDVAILITDQRMPEMTGIELLRQTATLRPHMSRILLTGYTDVEALTQAINCGLVDMYVTKPWNNQDLKERVAKALDQYHNNRKNHALKIANERLETRVREMKLGFATALNELMRSSGGYEYEHSFRVGSFAAEIAQALNLSESDREELILAAALNDIGREVMTTPLHLDAASDKTGPEQTKIQRVLTMLPELRHACDIIRFLNENFDGTGVPRGLNGERIPLTSRILRVADEFDSLTRSSAGGVNEVQAINELKKHSGRRFDPKVLEALATAIANRSQSNQRIVAEWQTVRASDSTALCS